MKYFFIVGLFLISCLASGQTTPTTFFERAIMKTLPIPDSLYPDSCYYSNTLLKVAINKNSKVSFITFSDNAEEWLATGLDSAGKKWDMAEIENFARKNHIRDGNLIVPVIVRSGSFLCKTRANFFWFNKKYFQFKGKNLTSAVFFADPVEIILQ